MDTSGFLPLVCENLKAPMNSPPNPHQLDTDLLKGVNTASATEAFAKINCPAEANRKKGREGKKMRGREGG